MTCLNPNNTPTKKMAKQLKRLSGIALASLLLSFTTLFEGDTFEISKNLEIFANVYKELHTSYVDELEPGTMMKTAINAMVSSLDPYTNYYSSSQIESQRVHTEGRYSGLGAQFDLIDEYPTIVEVYENSPAHKAGLRPGDQIRSINGKPAGGRSVEEVKAIVEGFPGTKLTLEVRPFGESQNKKMEITRGEINISNVPYYGMLDDKIGYVSLTIFTAGAAANIDHALRELRREHPNLEGLVLDLRYNPGGLLQEAVSICDLFLPPGEQVVAMRGKVRERDRIFETRRPASEPDLPIVVLVNKKSASASEIVSGSLQDLDRAVIMGQRSFGKGLVQNVRDVGYNARLKLTTAKYYIPSGRCIQAVRYENGQPVDIPDEQRAVFHTRNGRKVLDGGGVTPDVRLPDPTETPLIKALEEQYILMKFAAAYTRELDSLPPVSEYHFDDWAAFEEFLHEQQFSYETEAEREIRRAVEAAQKEGFDISREVSALRQKIDEAKAKALRDEKPIITRLIEQEIAKRFYFEPGKTEIALRDDPEIKAARSLLSDKQRYADLLH